MDPTEKSELDDFLAAEVATVDLTGVSLEPIPTPYWRWCFQRRLQVINECGGDGESFPVEGDA